MNVNRLSRYIESLKCPDGYRFSAFSGSTLLSTSFAILTKHLLAMNLSEDSGLTHVFLSQKNDDDYFVDKKYSYCEHALHGPAYVVPQFTFFSLGALDILGCRLQELKFLENYIGEAKIQQVLDACFARNFWVSSNSLMFMLYFLAYAEKYLAVHDSLPRTSVDAVFAALIKKQNRENGFWGSFETTPQIHHQAYATAHLLLFFDYYKKEIPRVEKIIDTSLKLHVHNGLVETASGGACEDYNLVDIYLRTSRQTDYRKGEILDVLMKMKESIIASQEACGGFPYRKPGKIYFWQRSQHTRIRSATYRYSSWAEMETFAYRSDIWATFFRVLAVTAIDSMAGRHCSAHSARLPCWGFI